MNPLLVSGFLLAESARAGQFAKGFRAGNLDRVSISSLLLIAAAGLIIALIFYAWDRFANSAQRGPLFNKQRLFHDLCRLHRLDRASVHCLERLSRSAKLSQAAEVFVRPDLFQPRQAAARDKELLQQLRGKLFPA